MARKGSMVGRRLVCENCGAEYPEGPRWLCERCFELLKVRYGSEGGRLEAGEIANRDRNIWRYLERLPVPDASPAKRDTVAKLAQGTQELHGRRRKRVERFLRDIGVPPAESSSKNKLEEPWNAEKCTDDYFRKKAKGYPLKLLSDVRAETIAMTDEILKVESEIDQRVAALYGL